jgi:hypothetical protein
MNSDSINSSSELKEFINLMVEFWDKNITKYFTKERDLRIATAVIEIFRNSDRIDQFNKKALYLYIRDISDCPTQQITKIVNRMKSMQRNITLEYHDTGRITGDRIYYMGK